jgi:hypothetical protein
MLLRKIVCGMALLLPLLAVADPIPANKLAYVGEWSGPGMVLSIDKDGGVRYNRATNGKATNFLGDVVGFTGNNFEVRVGSKRVTVTVDHVPGSNDGVWGMVVDGVKLVRVK